MYTTYIYDFNIPSQEKGGDNFPSVVCLDHRRGSIQVLDGKAPDPQGTMRDVVHLVSARVVVVFLLLSFRKQMKGVGCYGLLMFKKVWLCLLGGWLLERLVFFLCFFKFREEAIDQMKHLRMEVRKMSFLLKRMMLRDGFYRSISMKMTMCLIGKIDVERWLCLKDVEI